MGHAKKARAQQRKAAKAATLIRLGLIHGANKASSNQMTGASSLIPHGTLDFPTKGLKLSVNVNPTSMDQDTKEAIFEIFRENMQAMYEENWSWKPEEKKRELFHSTSRMLLVHSPEGNLAAFSHFRFEDDDEDVPVDAVLYVYELQVAQFYRRYGLGQHIMGILELLAMQFHMPKVMLTVFNNNPGAMAFYKEKMQYSVDNSSPSKFGKKSTYEILSRSFSATDTRRDLISTSSESARQLDSEESNRTSESPKTENKLETEGSHARVEESESMAKECDITYETDGIKEQGDATEDNEVIDSMAEESGAPTDPRAQLLYSVMLRLRDELGREPTMDEVKKLLRATVEKAVEESEAIANIEGSATPDLDEASEELAAVSLR